MPRFAQPADPVGLRLDHPSLQGLVFAAYPGGPELLRNVQPLFMGNGARSSFGAGRSFYSPGAGTDGIYWPLGADHPLYSIGLQDTVMILMSRAAGSAYNNVFGVPYRNGSWSLPYFSWALHADSSGDWGVVGVATNSSTWNVVDSNGTFYQNGALQVYGSIRNGATVKFMRGLAQLGSDRTMTSSTPDWTNKQPACLFNNSPSAPDGEMQAHGAIVLAWNRPLPLAEWQDVAQNMWALLEQDQAEMFYWATGGGGGGFQPAWAGSATHMAMAA